MTVAVGAELPDSIKQFLHDTMREEYEIGVTDGMTICWRGLKRSLPDYAQLDPSLVPGIKQAIAFIEIALEDRPQETKDKGLHAKV
jgi:hypothetical protein